MSQARDLANEANSAPGFSPAGTIIAFGGTTAPAGYLSCDGSAVSRTTYADLFAAIGTTWGNPDNSTFNVPDLRGAFLRGTGTHGTSNMANGFDYAGQAVGSFEADQMQGHLHAGTGSGNGEFLYYRGSGGYYDNFLTTGDGALPNEIDRTSSPTGNPSADASNGTPRTGDETRPFNASILYCIKT